MIFLFNVQLRNKYDDDDDKSYRNLLQTSCAGGRHNMPDPCKLTFDLESGVLVTCDVAYLCANYFSLRPLCTRLRPDVRDRQTDVRRASSLNAPALWGRGHNVQMLINQTFNETFE